MVRTRFVKYLTKCFTQAGDGNRTHVSSLEGWCSTIELHPHGTDKMLFYPTLYGMSSSFMVNFSMAVSGGDGFTFGAAFDKGNEGCYHFPTKLLGNQNIFFFIERKKYVRAVSITGK